MQTFHHDDGIVGRPNPSQCDRVRRLVLLLRGEGLDRFTLEELLRPESLSALGGILTERVFTSTYETPDDG